ncbi:MAG: CsbD family protein [Pirellulales bacterium]
MATQEKLMGNWNQLKGKVKQHWGQLTEDELQEVEGNIDQLIGLVQQKTGEGRQQIEKFLNSLSDDAGGTFTQASEMARQYADQATEAIRGATDQLRDRGMEGYEQAQQMVRSRPAESVAIAFGTGLIVGLVVGIIASSRNS